MAGTVPWTAAVGERVASGTAAIPWYVWCAVLAVTSTMVGVHWDIAWHRSIGRDTFWTPAHMAIYMGGVLAGISCGYLILSTTFGPASDTREAAVGIWGFRGPLGAFVAAWGGIAMIVSAPFDDWWHNAYGLDVKILSPPHVILIVGILAVEMGALILILGRMNRAHGAERNRLEWLYLYVAAMIMVILTVLVFEYTVRAYMHSGLFYRVVSMAIPVVLAGVARASSRRWAAASTTAIYSAFLLAMLWILPLFPAQPKLGPVYQNVTRFVPMEFPMLLIVPAIALDWLWSRTRGWNAWLLSGISGAVFLACFAAVQWPFSSFLMTRGARNWLFGTIYFDYNLRATDPYVLHQFYPLEHSAAAFRIEMLLALVMAMVTIRIGFAWGNWMRRIRR